MRRQRLFAVIAATLSAAVWAYACGDGATEPPLRDSPQPTVISVLPQETRLAVRSATVQLSAQVRDQSGQVMADVAVSWSSNDALVASVDGSGLVTAVANGTATITAAAGSASGRATVVVLDSPDRAVLAALYTATDGPNWVDADNWLTDTRLGEWYGVETNQAGRVMSLDLSGQWDGDRQVPIPHGLSGSIPRELGNLPHLVSLDLGVNHLTGSIPAALGNLAQLGYLDLTRNNLTRAIPPELGNLARLTVLALGGNALTGEIPSGLGNLVDLTELYLWGNNLTGPIPPQLGNLVNLTHLYLSDNRLAGPIPTELGGLANLTVLSLRGNDLTGPIPPELAVFGCISLLYNHLAKTLLNCVSLPICRRERESTRPHRRFVDVTVR